jgi:hypothetical protein
MATKPIPVRIPEEWLPRIDTVAKQLGTNRARLIAFSGQTFAEFFEKHGVSSMPPNWSEIFDSMDGRRRRKGLARGTPSIPLAKGPKKKKTAVKAPARKAKR